MINLFLKLTGGGPKRNYLTDGESTVVLDVVTSENWTKGASPTSNTVEEGLDVTDHVKADAISVSLSAVMTNYADDSFADAAINPKKFITGFASNVLELPDEDKISDRLNILDDWRKNGTLLTYHGVQRTIESCILTQADESKDQSTGDGLNLSVALQEVRIAGAELVDIQVPPPARPVAKKGTQTTEKGEKNAKEGKSKSLLKKFVG